MKRIFSLLTVLFLVVSMLQPVQAIAVGNGDLVIRPSNDAEMVPAPDLSTLVNDALPASVASGTCGDNLTWTLDEDGTLTISGTGAMWDWDLENRPPWRSYRTSIKEVVIEAGVTTIGNFAFMDCGALNCLTIGSDVATVGALAFYGCGGLDNVTIPDSVNVISDSAFSGCDGLSSLTIGSNVTVIKDEAFAYCKNLTSIVIPGKVTAISNGAFADCSGLTEIWFQCKAPTFRGGVFGGVTATAYYPANNETWTEEVRQDYGGSITWVSYAYEVPPEDFASGECGDNLTWTLNDEGLLTISGTGAMWDGEMEDDMPWFAYCHLIKEVVIEPGVTTIGDYAFSICTDLSSVSIPGSVTTIGGYSFYFCYNLSSVAIPEGVTTIGHDAFNNCSNLSSVTIPNSVTTIGNCAFFSCALASVTIPGSVTSIGAGAFAGCPLSGIWVEASNPNYSNDDYGVLFNKDKTVLLQAPGTISGSYTIPDGVTIVAESAFFECYDLKDVSIPHSVTTIGSYAFTDCAFSSVSIPDSVTTIGIGAFNNCSFLTGIWVDESNRYYSSDDNGALYDKNKTTLIQVPTRTSGNYTIRDGVTTIESCAFYACSNLRGVTIPEGVTSIGDYAFYYCINITGVILPSSVVSIGESAFYYCFSLASVTIPEGVAIIGADAFNSCYRLNEVTIPGSVTTIGYSAFAVSGLREITFQGNAPAFGQSVFSMVEATAYYPSNNETWTEDVRKNYGGRITWVAYGSEAEIIDSGACGDNLTWTLNDEGLLTISGTGAMWDWDDWENLSPWFAYQNLIHEVVVESGVTTVGNNAFWDCLNLSSVNLPEGIETIGAWAFLGCSNLSTVTLPDSVTTIGNAAFWNCVNLSIVTIPNSVTTIGEDAFADCINLTSVTIPGSVTTIGAHAFSRCTSLTGIWVDASNAKYSSDGTGVLFDKDKSTLIQAPGGLSGSYAIPTSVTTIGGEAFMNCFNLSEVTIANSVTIIGDNAFMNCGDLNSVTIPNTVQMIGEAAFAYSGLECVTIPGSVTTIGVRAFSYCRLTGIWVDASNQNYSSDDSGVLFNKEKTTLIQAPQEIKGEYSIPSSVITIGGNAFERCNSLDSVTLPEGIVDIGEFAFSDCSGLMSITIPDSVETIDVGAFMGCISLSEIYFQGNAPSFGESVFCDVTATAYYPANDETWTEEVRQDYGGSITWVAYEREETPEIIASGVCGDNLTWTLNDEGLLTITGTGAMWDGGKGESFSWDTYTENIKEIVIDTGVTTIGDHAFPGLSNLSSVTIGDSVETIGIAAFNYCTSLRSVTMGCGVATIGVRAFNGCYSLSSITIPNSVTTIGSYAFCDCESLTEIYFTGNAPAFGEDVFSGVTATVYYPGNDETWTAAVRQNYGGNITWVANTSYMVGDANSDGTVNPLDALMLLQCYVGMLDAEAIPLTACDCNGDGTVNPLDALLLLQYYIGMIDKFPVE